MRKLNIEIHPYATKGLSPRHHISNGMFRRLRDRKIDKLRERCEVCGSFDKIELHEAGAYKNRTYILKGFHLLCAICHDMVHCIQLPTNRIGIQKDQIDFVCRRYAIRRLSRFNTKVKLIKHVDKAFDHVFDFMMADRVSCDYSIAAKYGLNPKDLKRGFEMNYNHFSCRIRYMVDYLRWFLEREKTGFNDNPRFYELYADPEKVKARQAILYQEYLRHKDFYTDNKPLFGNASPEKERVIFEYAETMKAQLTASKHKSQTKSK